MEEAKGLVEDLQKLPKTEANAKANDDLVEKIKTITTAIEEQSKGKTFEKEMGDEAYKIRMLTAREAAGWGDKLALMTPSIQGLSTILKDLQSKDFLEVFSTSFDYFIKYIQGISYVFGLSDAEPEAVDKKKEEEGEKPPEVKEAFPRKETEKKSLENISFPETQDLAKDGKLIVIRKVLGADQKCIVNLTANVFSIQTPDANGTAVDFEKGNEPEIKAYLEHLSPKAQKVFDCFGGISAPETKVKLIEALIRHQQVEDKTGNPRDIASILERDALALGRKFTEARLVGEDLITAFTKTPTSDTHTDFVQEILSFHETETKRLNEEEKN
ncbi:MAG: hypothetical protein Q8O95_05105 [bacterium]|nr:hypothetical protein [bacterium]